MTKPQYALGIVLGTALAFALQPLFAALVPARPPIIAEVRACDVTVGYVLVTKDGELRSLATLDEETKQAARTLNATPGLIAFPCTAGKP